MRGFRRELLQNRTPQELKLAKWLKEAGLSVKEQHPSCGKFFIDIWLPQVKVAIELDGLHHNEPTQAAQDQVRERRILAGGSSMIRIPNRCATERNLQRILNLISIVKPARCYHFS